MINKYIFTNYSIKYFRSKQIIFSPFYFISDAYYLEKGFVKIYKVTQSGSEIIFSILEASSVLPLLILLDYPENEFYYEALTDCRVRAMPLTSVKLFIKNNTEFRDELIKKLVNSYGNLVTRLDMIQSNDALARVASSILYLNKKVKQGMDEPNLLSINLNHELISSLACTTRETATRKLEELSNKKIITTGYNKIEILNISELAKIANIKYK